MTQTQHTDPAPVQAPSLPPSADLVVIGGGTAGIVAATTAAGFGANVVRVERDRTGGDCLWTGCVPSKSLIAAASAAAAIRRAPFFGIDAANVTVDFGRVTGHVRGAIAAVAPVDSPQALTDAGVTVVPGSARFTGARTLAVDDDRLAFAQAVIATGARPALPDLPGLEALDYLTSETLWGLTELPPRLLVLGGGSIGCELAQAFARLGSAVTLVESADTLVPQEDPAAGAALTASMIADGVEVLTAATAQSISRQTLILADARRIGFDRVLVAVGRTPRTASLGLDAAGVTVDHDGCVVVDDQLRTTNPRVWAAGDPTGHPQFTHTAAMHASIAATNAILGLRHTARRIPGLRVHTLRHRYLDRTITEANTGGLTNSSWTANTASSGRASSARERARRSAKWCWRSNTVYAPETSPAPPTPTRPTTTDPGTPRSPTFGLSSRAQ